MDRALPVVRGGSLGLDAGARLLEKLAVVAILCAGSVAWAGDVQYVYDRAGRLVGVVDANGGSARYEYDRAGNIKSIKQFAVNELWLGEFSPAVGPAGTSVTLHGGGFSTTPASNTVRFNGTVAMVTAATANTLTVTVPADATTGPVSVKVGTNTVSSAAAFVVGAAPGAAPKITSFTPTFGDAGTAVTLTGTRFDPDKANDLVLLNGRASAVTTATSTKLQVVVPAQATSGKFTVRTPSGSATSSADFFVTPSGISSADIQERGRIQPDGAPVAVADLAAGKYAQYLFDAVAGRSFGLGFSGFTGLPADGNGTVSVLLRAPDGTAIDPKCTSVEARYGDGSCNLSSLPQSGTYQVLVRADSAHSASFNLVLSTDGGSALVPNADPVTFTAARAGQNGRYTFAGSVGNSYGIALSDVTIPGTWTYVRVLAPNGAELVYGYVGAGHTPPTVDVVNVPTTGTYTVFVDPYRAGAGQVKLALREPAAGSLAIDGAPAALSLLPGQNGVYTFTGAADRRLGLGLSGLSTTPAGGSVHVRLYGPTGALVADCGAATSDTECDFPPLPVQGKYSVKVDPAGIHAAAMTLTLSADIADKLVVNAPSPTTFNTTRPGQNGRYTFSGTTGRNYSIALSDVTIPGTWTNVTVHAPDGTELAQGYTGAGYPPPAVDVSNVPATGTYSVFVDPFRAATGQLRLALAETAAGSLTIDGAPTSVNLLAGQNGQYTFAGVAGRRLGLGVSGVATTPAGGDVAVKLHGPTGAVVADCGSGSTDFECDFPALPASGTYTLKVDGRGGYATALTLTLSSDVAGTLTVDSPTPTTFSTSRAGQNGRYTFAGKAGKNYTIAISDITIAGTWTVVTVFAPDGAELASGFAGAGYAPPAIDVVNAPSTGNYAVVVDPFRAATGEVKLALTETVSGTLVLDGAPTPVSLLAGQNGQYSFSGSAGQQLGLGLAGVATTPAGGDIAARLYGPTGALIADCGNTATDAECDFPTLPSTGTYVVRIDPRGTVAATLNLSLSRDLTDTLVVDAGVPTTFSTSRAGQNGRYTFAGERGKNYSIPISDVTITGTWTVISVLAPDGSELARANAGAGYSPPTLVVNNLPATGSYQVVVDPFRSATGQLRLKVVNTGVTDPGTQTPNGSIAVNGAPLGVDVPVGQTHLYTFSATAGQRLGLGVTNIVSAPANQRLRVFIKRPDNITTLAECGTDSTAYSCDFGPLPSTGTYTVAVQPSAGSSATATLTLSTDSVAALAMNGAGVRFDAARPGQNGRFTFTGTEGRRTTIAWTDATIPGNYSYLRVYRPDGVLVASSYFSADSLPNGALELGTLVMSGNHTVFIDPLRTNAGQVTVSVRENATGTVAVDGAATPVSLLSGQAGRYSFTGAKGQRLGLGITGITTTPANGTVAVRVVDPNERLIKDCGNSATDFSCDIGPLLVAGKHVVEVEPARGGSAALGLVLSNDAGGEVSRDPDAPTLFATERAGQNGRYTFSGTAGQATSVVWTEATFPGYWSYLYVYKPDGTRLASHHLGAAGPNGILDLGTLTDTGTYTVLIDPLTTGTGQVKVAVPTQDEATLVIDGSSRAVSLKTGQGGRYEFTGKVGQNLGIGVTGLVLVPSQSGVSLRVYDPSGRMVKDCSSYSRDGACVIPTLVQAGTYSVIARPTAANSASFSLMLSKDLSAEMTPNADTATVFDSSRPGQNGRYTFKASSGQHLSLAWRDATISGYWSYLHVENPDGSRLLGNRMFSKESSSSGFVDLGVAADTGTFTLLVDPHEANTGQVTLFVNRALTGSLVVDADAVAVALSPGRLFEHSFVATSGQRLGAVLSEVTTSPAPRSEDPFTMQLLSPTGQVLETCTLGGEFNSSCRFPAIPAAGTYRVLLHAGPNASSFKIRIRSTI
ncbi:MAG TPA: IPT/TIG domain-containing protein [Ideonella sp.]|uniref:IPT/TIG domain-containing protein n=1 Tax=Ideonella sp. TaxID=1929293 RepID=UPI002E335AEE|nr:IPT/TIG domain-containing protein [Ideonella sp.]HEX5682809.1 IPT/TIG domain-containing protein [Ideonella sp.]